MNLEGNAGKEKERERERPQATTGKFGFKGEKPAVKKEEPTAEPGMWRNVKK